LSSYVFLYYTINSSILKDSAIMQAAHFQQSISAFSRAVPTDDTPTPSTYLLPLHRYQQKVSITNPALPLQALATSTLPAELITMIQHYFTRQDILALSAVNQAALSVRFDSLPVKFFCFNTARQVEAFLKTLHIEGGVRTVEDLQPIKKLILSLSAQLSVEQCIPLLPHLTAVNHLQVYLSSSQPLADLAPLCQAAQQLAALVSFRIGNFECTNEELAIKNICKDEVDAEAVTFEKNQLPDTLWQLTRLKTLKLIFLKNLAHLSEGIGQLTALTSLELSLLGERLTELPCTIGQLINLEELSITHCSALKSLPETLGQLKALKKLELTYLDSLNQLPTSIGQLDHLESLVLSLSKVKSLPEEIGQLKALRLLNLGRLELLGSLPASLGQLESLEELKLQILHALTVLPEEIGQLTRLTSLHLGWLEALQVLPTSLWQLKNLKELVCQGSACIKTFPEKLDQLSNLTSLELRYVTLPASIGQLKSLKKLTLEYAPMSMLPREIGQLTALKELRLYDLPLKTLPRDIGQLVKLENLSLLFLRQLETIPDEIGQLKQLKSLRLLETNALKALPTTIGQLDQLENLDLDEKSIETLPEEMGQLKALTALNLSMRSLKTLPVSLGQLHNLQQILHLKAPRCTIPPELKLFIKPV
jgi:Leucine-rich repeat (LRR) protein